MTPAEKCISLLIDTSNKLEPCDVEVCCDEVNETKIVYESTDFSVASTSTATLFGLRTIANHKLGFITTNSLDEKELVQKVSEAQLIARLSPESPYHKIAEKQKTEGLFQIWDNALSEAQPKDVLKWLEHLVQQSQSDPRVALDRAELTVSATTRTVQNSNGVTQKLKQTSCGWFVMGMAKSGDEVTSFDYDGNSCSKVSEIETRIDETARNFRESVLGSLGARGCKSYKGLVLFHPDAVAHLLASVIGFNVSGRAQQDGMSKWKGVLGKQVASEVFSFSEHPLDETRPADFTPFDREGIPCQNHEIVKDGTLCFTAHNLFSAARGNTHPTGNAVGGARSLPTIGLHNLTVAQGKASDKDLYKALGTGLVLKRFSGNADPVSGAFSGIAKNSWWVENGERVHPLKEVMVAGNMFDLLSGIELVGSTIHRQMGSFDSPYVLVNGVSVTSA